MNPAIRNLKNFFRDTRTRTILVVTGAVLAFGIIVGFIRLSGHTAAGPETVAAVKETPNVESTPGGWEKPVSPEYAKLQEQENQIRAKDASNSGGSAIPTIIRSSNFAEPPTSGCPASCTPCPCPGGGGATATGLPIGQTSSLGPGTLVYDAQGRVIGKVGADGKVRDANGNVIGTVGADGLVRDASGNVIGAAGSAAEGTPVYDANGKLLGTVGADGKVRDANGNVIGTVGPDGVVRDLTGNVIGKTGVASAGAPAYDANGKLLGTVGADGKVRDANGNVIGTVGPDGVVRDLKGNVIGKASSVAPGTPIYDANGKLLGRVGADGKVRDANGNVIGTVGPDGVLRDATGKVLSKAGVGITGTPVYDAQGRLIGVVGTDGKMRDANGKVIGTLGLDGTVRDAEGNVVGSTRAPTPITAPPATGGGIPGISTLPQQGGPGSSDIQAAMQRQTQVLAQQKVDQLQQQMQSAIASQASQLIAAWAPPMQQVVAGAAPSAQQTSTQQAAAAAAAASAAGNVPPVVKAGTVMFAILKTAINSDEPGPILATIVSGKFKGGQLIGTLVNQGQKVLLNFNTLTMPDVPRSVAINVVAIDPNTARTALSSDTNNHYLLRYGTLFASSFLQGYGQAVSQSGQTVTSTGLATQTSYPNLTAGGKFMVALGNVGTHYSSILGNVFSTPPTVQVYSGTAMGLLFLTDVPPLPTS